MMDTADVMLAAAVALLLAWLVRRVWMDDRAREETATDEAWHDGARMLRRAREALHRRP